MAGKGFKTILVFSMLATCVAVLGCSGGADDAQAKAKIWRPGPTTAAWQFQLQGKIDQSIKAPVYEVDGFDVSAKTVKQLHQKGRKVICYIDVGSWENYRADAGEFPKSVIGKRYQGYPDESWLDIRKYKLFAKPLKARIQMCAKKGFDGLEPDNVNGVENPTGFPLTGADQLRFNRWIAKVAHKDGLSVALKNDGPQAKKLVNDFDYAVVEQCFQYNECGQYQPFVRKNKAVFSVEYELAPDKFCSKAKAIDFASIRKSYDLFAKPWKPCS
jgi:hypothetical protein